MARMHDWKTWSFDNIVVEHMRPVGARNSSALLKARFNLGVTDYCMGSDPFFMIAKCFRRSIIEAPYVWSGLARLYGYIYGYLTSRIKRQIPLEVIKYLRHEQRIRLKELFLRKKLTWRP